MELFKDVSQLTLFVGVMAFLVSCVTEVLKKITWFEKHVPTVLVAIAVSVILCPVALLGLAAYYEIVIEWYMVFASFVAAFVVSLVAIDGWERVSELAGKLIKK